MNLGIVILNWNGEELLSQFLPSLINFTPIKHNIYIIDNGSNDNSIGFVENNYKRIKVIKLDTNYGYAKGYNIGLKNINDDAESKAKNIIALAIQKYAASYTSEKINELNADTNNLINDHPPDIIFVYSKRSAESFIDLAKKYSLNGLMTGSRVMCISEKVINVFKEAGWKNLETFEAGDELIKIGN